MTTDEFAQSIKAKYPEYKNVDNLKLAKAMVAKFPQYADKVTFGSGKTPGALGGVADFVGGGKLAQGIGQSLANAGGAQSGLIQANNQSMDLQTKLLQTIKADTAQGKDTSKLQKALNDLTQSIGNQGEQATQLGTGGLSNKEVIGSSIQLASNLIPGAPKGSNLLTKVGVGAAKGYVTDVGNKLQDPNKTIGQAFVPGAGTLIGGVIPLASAAVQKVTQNLPTWLVKKALPKLDSGNTQTALKKPIGTISTLYNDSQKAVQGYESQVQSILKNSKYENEVGRVSDVVNSVKSGFPNAGFDDKKIVNIVKQVAKVNSTLVDKVANGEATLTEQNLLRKELDHAVYPKFTDTPSLTFNKQVAKQFSDLLRTNVQTTAHETGPIFSEYAKEINFNKALSAASKKIQKGAAVGLYDIASYFGGGLPGVVAEKTVRAPAAQLTAAKGLQKLGNFSQKKIPSAVGSAAKRTAVLGASKITQ